MKDWHIFCVGWRHLSRSAASSKSVGYAVHGWTGVRIGTVHSKYIVNHENLRVSANWSAGTFNTDPSAAWWKGEAREAEKTEEKVGSFPRKESLLLRWTDHRGPAERGLAPHPGPHSRHKWIVLYIWVSSCYHPRVQSLPKWQRYEGRNLLNRAAILRQTRCMCLHFMKATVLFGILDLRRTVRHVLQINKKDTISLLKGLFLYNTQLNLKSPDFIM